MNRAESVNHEERPISIDRWREGWAGLTASPDARDYARERAFLEGHAAYGARIHEHVSEVLIAGLVEELNAHKRHALALRLFTEFANALESLGAWGWTIQRRRSFRLFLDGFLSYPLHAPREFFVDVTNRPPDEGIVELLHLPPRADVIRAARELVPESTARQVGEYLDAGMERLRQSAEQYFAGEMAVLHHYNRTKHGTSIVRLDEHTHDEHDFQILAPERHPSEIAPGRWYNVALFDSNEEFIGRVRGNTVALTHSIRFMATIAWALYRADRFYSDPAAETA